MAAAAEGNKIPGLEDAGNGRTALQEEVTIRFNILNVDTVSSLFEKFLLKLFYN